VKPSRFAYHRPRTVEEAVALLAEFGDDAKILAGGQSLVPLLALRLTSVEHLIDLNRIAELQGITHDSGDAMRVAAMTRQAVIERSADVADAVPLLSRAVPYIGHFQIRNRGTVGGSVAHADPASELPAVALALDAEVQVKSARGARTIAASDLFKGTWTTSIMADELITALRFPVWSGRRGFAVDEFARRKGDFAIAGAVCGVEVGDDRVVRRVVIALMGMGSTPVRAVEAEALLTGCAPDAAQIDEAGRVAAAAGEPSDDIHAPAAYRRRVAAHLVGRALNRALEEAGHARG
jgi:aerobic carbon-monoxide dehydrogenase medium subunit